MATCKYCGKEHAIGMTSIPSCVDVKIAQLESELAQAKKNYLDLADTVCRESTSVAHACEQARETRLRVTEAQDQRDNATKEMNRCHLENNALMEAGTELRDAATTLIRHKNSKNEDCWLNLANAANRFSAVIGTSGR